MKRALVTGASSGLGMAFADQLLEEGWHVLMIDRAQMPAAGRTGLEHWQCDLSDTGSINELLADLGNEPPFDCVIFNAGASATGRFEAIAPEVSENLIRLNLLAPMRLASGLAAAGGLAGGCNLLFIASLSHYTGYPGAATYAATKDALAVYARSIRKPFARRGVTVSCAFPGPLRTPHAERHSPPGADASRRMAPKTAARRILASARAGRHRILPGTGAKVMALAGKLFPGLSTTAMRKLIYDRLDREVW